MRVFRWYKQADFTAPRSIAFQPLQFILQFPDTRLRPDTGIPFLDAGVSFPIQFLAQIVVGGDMPPGQRVNPEQRGPFPAQDQV